MRSWEVASAIVGAVRRAGQRLLCSLGLSGDIFISFVVGVAVVVAVVVVLVVVLRLIVVAVAAGLCCSNELLLVLCCLCKVVLSRVA